MERFKFNETHLKSPKEIICTSEAQLAKLLQCTEQDAKILRQVAAKKITKLPLEVSSIIHMPTVSQWSRLSFGCSSLDDCTGGGLVTRGITEVYGPAGAGKTQILLQLSLTVQLPIELGGLNKGVAFICTESAFPSRRIAQMCQHFKNRFPGVDTEYMNNIFVEHVFESSDLLQTVAEKLLKLISSYNIGLIVIDSVAAIFRLHTNYIERAKSLRKMANCLLYYANNYNLVVVCSNQITSVPGKAVDQPCLGMAWAHLGRTRIKILQIPKEISFDNKLLTVRRMDLLYSPENEANFAEFIITSQGVMDKPTAGLK